MSEKVRIGVIGCGNISGQYLGNTKKYPSVEIAALSDLDLNVAKAKAAEFGISRVISVDELLKDPAIDIVLNLTVPKAHVPVALRALEAGKHTYAEKPLGVDRTEARKMMDFAKQKKLLVGCAPDTFMGAGVQTARKLIDDGAIGKPTAFTAFMLCPGHESWHPNPAFYYEVGGGPMFDMGPYYLTALLNLFGPVKRIMGMASVSRAERPITHKDGSGKPGPKFGQMMPVQTPDHIAGTMEFANGVVGTLITSFATAHPEYNGRQPITVYGTQGTIRVPDPNGFDGTVSLRGWSDAEWKDMPFTTVTGYGRGVGLLDMAYAVRSGRPFRANGEQAFTVLDLMQGFLDSSNSGKAYIPSTTYTRPAAMPADLPFGTLEK